MNNLFNFIKSEAAELGFSCCGFTNAKPLTERTPLLWEWLKRKYHGEMSYMERNVDKRLNPQLLFPDAKTIVSFLINYYPRKIGAISPTLPYPSNKVKSEKHAQSENEGAKVKRQISNNQYPMSNIQHIINSNQQPASNSQYQASPPDGRAGSIQYPKISMYALGKDYHIVVKEKLERLLKKIREKNNGIDGRAFVGSAPIMEKVWAQQSGLGWLGKNTLLINKHFGSFCFIGEIILDIHLEDEPPTLFRIKDQNQKDYCGKCTRCIDACPTGALVAPYILDARRCISYLTVEQPTPTLPYPEISHQSSVISHRSAVARNQKPETSNWLFGCDVCQLVCPWNSHRQVVASFAKQSNEPSFEPNPALLNMTIDDWNNLDKKTFYSLFKDTPLMRAGYERIMKNLENSRQ